VTARRPLYSALLMARKTAAHSCSYLCLADRQCRLFERILQAAIWISTLCLLPCFPYFPYSTYVTHLIPLPLLHTSYLVLFLVLLHSFIAFVFLFSHNGWLCLCCLLNNRGVAVRFPTEAESLSLSLSSSSTDVCKKKGRSVKRRARMWDRQ